MNDIRIVGVKMIKITSYIEYTCISSPKLNYKGNHLDLYSCGHLAVYHDTNKHSCGAKRQ